MSSSQNSIWKSIQNIVWNGIPFIFAVAFGVLGIIEIKPQNSNTVMLASYLLGVANLLVFLSLTAPAGYVFLLIILGLGVGWLFRNLWEKGKKFRFILLAVFISNWLCWAFIIVPVLRSMFSD